VQLWKPNDWNATGGIVIADHANFRNNWRSVSFMTYHNTHPTTGAIAPNRSRFRHCNFEWDDNYYGDGPVHAGATLYKVEGIYFTACTFANNQTSAVVTEASQLGHGIIGVDAQFKVKAEQSTSGSLDHSTFHNLYHGVWTMSTGFSMNTYEVDQAVFTDNIYGIKSEAVNEAVISRNSFTLGGNPYLTPYGTKQEGVVINTGTNYLIEDNSFQAAASLIDEPIGVRISNSGEDYNRVYRNSFDGLFVGNLSNYLNRSQIDPEFGLEYLCNTATNNQFDIAATGEFGSQDGVRDFQGNAAVPAGNTFSQNGLWSDGDFANQVVPTVEYNYFMNTLTEEPLFTSNVNKQAIPNQNTCESSFSTGTPIPSDGLQVQQLVSDYEQQLLNLNNYRVLYAAAIDGGDTDALLAEVNTSWPNETWVLRQELLFESPFLSQEVLMGVAERNSVFPDAIQYEILAANPDVLRKEAFIDWLRETQHLPSYMIDQLTALSGQQTYRSILENEMARYGAQAYQTNGLLLQGLAQDTLSYDSTDWLSRLQAQESLMGQMRQLELYLAVEQHIDAASVFQQLTAYNDFADDAQLIAFDEYLDLKDVQVRLQASGLRPDQLPEDDLVEVRRIAEVGHRYAGQQARNWLTAYYGEEYATWPLLPVGETRSAFIPFSEESEMQPGLTVMPNPAQHLATFSWHLNAGPIGMQLLVMDDSGKRVYQTVIQGQRGQLAVNTSDWPAGTYVYALTDGESTLERGKLVILH